MHIYTDELPGEVGKKVENTFRDIAEMNRAIAFATTQRDILRSSLRRTLDTIGLEVGQGLRSLRLGLYAMVCESEQRSLSRKVLIGLGVSEEIIEMATITKKTRPYMRVGQASKRKRQKGNGGTNGGTNARTETDSG